MNPLQKLNTLNKQSNTYQAELLELMSSIAKEARGIEKLYEVITINNTLETRTFTFLLAQKANQPATK